MSDIQEEQKRLYKRAEENDIKLLKEEINRLNNIINKAIEYIKEDMYVEPKELYGLVDGEHLLNILQDKEQE